MCTNTAHSSQQNASSGAGVGVEYVRRVVGHKLARRCDGDGGGNGGSIRIPIRIWRIECCASSSTFHVLFPVRSI